MHYTVVFDVAEVGIQSGSFSMIGLILVAASIGLVVGRDYLWPKLPRFVPYVCVGGAIAWTAFALVRTLDAQNDLASTLREGRCEVTEGVVREFHPMPKSGHSREWFTVNGKHFEYSDYLISPGFSKTASHGGPIREGLPVRIHHRGNDIARLEIAR